MTIKELNKAKLPIVKIDKKLDKLAGKTLFPEKLKDANEVLSSAGLPKSQKPAASQNGSPDRKSVRHVKA